jgi:hypothetical protein
LSSARLVAYFFTSFSRFTSRAIMDFFAISLSSALTN